MALVPIILQAVLALAFFGSGAPKIIGAKAIVANFQRWRFPRWFVTVTGLVEWIGSIGLVVGIRYPLIAVLAGVWLTITMISAVNTHLFRAHEPFSHAIPPAVLALLSIAVGIINWPTLMYAITSHML